MTYKQSEKKIFDIDHEKIIVDMSMRNLLERLNEESFILYLQFPITKNLILEEYRHKIIDEKTLEVTLSNNKTLYELFYDLNKQGVMVLSIKNKSNRLEELFLTLTRNNK